MLTVLCCFSKFGMCVLTRNIEASTMATAMLDYVFLKWSLCFEVLVDQDPKFEAELTPELFNDLGVRHLRTSGYHSTT